MDNYKYLPNFPKDILNLIIKNLNMSDRISFYKTCTKFHQLLENDIKINELKDLFVHNKLSMCLKLAAKENNIKLVNICINKGALNHNYGLYGAAEGNHINLVDFFINNGNTRLNWGLMGAVRGNHINLVDFFINKGADALNWGLEEAVKGNHIGMVKYFINKGANDLTNALYFAKHYKYDEIVKYLEGRN